ncbi:MAG: DUF488 domain-containing protein [Actinobacteria bacterium]|nr:DUF488 domain-containing protein [Actinomycetota bacterium]
MAERIATIGVYGFDLERFLGTLATAGVGVVVDVRQRRGVRGREYAWANAQRLQAALAAAGVGYRHHRELAPTTAMREAQYRADARVGEGKRSRTHLSLEFARLYTEQVLDRADLEPIAVLARESLPALLCVERDTGACHRHLVADRLAREFGFEPVHLHPA